VLRLLSSVILLTFAPICVADEHWSNWSDKTLCRLALADGAEEYRQAALSRSLICVATHAGGASIKTKDANKTEDKIVVKGERFFQDQPDVDDDYKIHFNYLVTQDGEDREWDISGKLESLLLKLNEEMYTATKANRYANGEGKRYKFDYRQDGKLDITFIRMDKYRHELDEQPGNDIAKFMFQIGMKDPKKIYFNFADFNHEDGGTAGVGVGNIYLRHHKMTRKGFITINTLHELHHTQGGAYACVPGTNNNHLEDRFDGTKHQLKGGLKLNNLVYKHPVEGCPQLADSVYLTPTSTITYDPYELNCLFNLGRYTHKKMTAPIQKLRDAGRFNWRVRFGSSCQWRNQNRDHEGYFLMGSNLNIIQ
jgi:hypothetical protein